MIPGAFLRPGYFFIPKEEHEMKRKSKIKEISLIGLMGALGMLLMLFKFPLPFMPPFMDFDLTGLVEIIGGFMLGPVAAIFIILVKVLLKTVIMGSTSMLTGEIQNFILSCAFVLPAVLIYQHHKTRKSAVVGMIVGTIICAIVSVFTNLYLIIPFYVNLFGMSMESIIQMCSAVNPLMKNPFTLAVFGIMPFNIIKNGVSSMLAFILYKKVSKPLKNYID